MSVQLSTPRAESAEPTSPLVIPHEAGRLVDLDGFGIHWKLDGLETGKRFSVVHHPIAPRHLAAPLHRHHREDEFSYVLSGKMGALLGDDVVVAEAGTWVAKPRNQWHSFWNAGDTPCRILEIISSAGFEHFFNELGERMAETNAASVVQVAGLPELGERYGIHFQPESIARLCQEHGLVYPA